METLNIPPLQQVVFDDLKRLGGLIYWFGTIMNNKKMYDINRKELRLYVQNLRSKNIITDTEVVKIYSLARHFGRDIIMSMIN